VGVWRVEVSVNPEHWKMHSGAGKMDRTTNPNRVNDPNRPLNDPNRPSTDPNRPATDRDRPVNDPTRPATDPEQTTKPTPPSDPNRDSTVNPTDPNNPNRVQDPFKRDTDAARPGQPGTTQPGTTQPGMTDKMVGGKTFVGYAETKLIMGDHILQQQMVVPDMLNDGLGREPGRVDGAPAAGNEIAINNEMYRGMSFLAFDDASNEYTIVFLDSRRGEIHCDKGTYDESSRRIVFHGKDDHAVKGGAGDRRMSDHGDVRVVLEVLSPTQHRVTMYASDVSGAGTRTGTGDTTWKNPNDIQNRNPADAPATTDGTRRDTTPARPTDPTNPNKNTQDNKISPDSKTSPDTRRDADNNRLTARSDVQGTMIYQATYTRASNEDSPRFRRLLQEPGTPMIDRDGLRPTERDLDRTNPTTPATPAKRPGERDD
jgi:hypothetical protein